MDDKPAKSGVDILGRVRFSCQVASMMEPDTVGRCPACGATITLRYNKTLIIDHTTRYDREAEDDKPHEGVSKTDGQGR